MGRAKAKMELIAKEKDRNTTFQNMNKYLKKKVYELATLCDIKAMMIIHGPKKATPQSHPLEPEIWPENRDEVLELINKYKAQPLEDRQKRTTPLSYFFKEKIKKAQEDLTTQRNTNFRSKYPTWDSRFSSWRKKDFRDLDVLLENVIGKAKGKLEQKKTNIISHVYDLQQQHRMLGKKGMMDFDVGNQANKYIKIDPSQAISNPMQGPVPMPFPIQRQRFSFIDHNFNPNQMMVKFGNEYAGGTSNIVHNAPLSENAYNYPMMAGTLNAKNYVNDVGRAHPNYYGEGRQPIAPHILEYQPMREGYNSHQMVAGSHQFYEDRKWQM